MSGTRTAQAVKTPARGPAGPATVIINDDAPGTVWLLTQDPDGARSQYQMTRAAWDNLTGRPRPDQAAAPPPPAGGDRVGFTVMRNDGCGSGLAHIIYRTGYGRVTSTWPAAAPAMARIAVENPAPGSARYVTRKIRAITPAPLAGSRP